MRILISGAGIAGSSLAFWLGKLGHDVTVIEWYPTLRTTGLQIDLRGHGIEVLKRMGLEQAFRAKSAPEQGIEIIDSTGRRRAFFPANTSGKGLQSFTSEFEIMRGDLCRLLYDASKTRAKYVFGSSVESFEDKGSCVKVKFADGETDEFDLLVGADGQWSRTRKMLLGSDTEGVNMLHGQHVAYFTLPRPIQEGEGYIATAYIAPGKRGVQLRRNNPDDVQVYLGCTSGSERLRNARRGDVREEKEALAELFDGAGWQTEQIVKAMMDAGDFYCERMAVVKLDAWSRGRVALTGDAAWTPSANTGMGTTAALVGSYVLAGEIGRHCGRADREGAPGVDGVAAAFEAYHGRYAPFMDQVQKGIVERRDFYPASSLGISIMTNVLALAAFLRLDIIGRYFLREDVKGWDLPTYEELLQ